MSVGDIVWAKAPHYSWWPAQIWQPDGEDDKKPGVVVVFLDRHFEL